MSPRTFVSIITVTWQDLPGLQKTASSIDSQTCRDYEWIVVDGGSTDGTSQWLAARHDPQCDWSSGKDAGTYDAMNEGLRRAAGRYVIFMNGGDSFASAEILDRLLQTARSENEPDLLYGDALDVTAHGRELYRPARDPAWLRFGMFTSHQAMLFRRDRCPELRYDLEYPTSADYAFVADFLRGRPQMPAPRCVHVPAPICRFALGGTHFVKRRRGLAEDFRIRRRVLREPLFLAAGLYALHSVHHALKLVTPGLTNAVRYRTPAAA